MGTISGLFIYPIKGCAGIRLTSSVVEAKGLRFDRRWMLVHADTGGFLSQRSHSQLATLVVAVAEDGTLSVSTGETKTFSIPFIPDEELRRREVTVWSYTGPALDAGNDAASFFSDSFGLPVRLVRTPEDFTRRINPKYAVTPEDSTGFADGYPVLVTTEPSLVDLNNRLDTPVPMNRFRPNIVLRGSWTAWSEDSWRTIRCGEVLYHSAKPCGRCLVTTIDQETGKKMDAEPLVTLAKFRRDAESNNVNFGMNLIPDIDSIGNQLYIGDPVTVEPRV